MFDMTEKDKVYQEEVMQFYAEILKLEKKSLFVLAHSGSDPNS